MLTAPFFEIGPKNLLRLPEIIAVASAASEAGRRERVSVILTVPGPLVAPVRSAVTDVFVFAQAMSEESPGASVGRDIAESLTDAGAHGVMLNHDSRPLKPLTLQRTVRRAQQVGLMTMVCVGSDEEALAAAELSPTVVLYEPPELIGSSGGGERPWIREINRRVAAAAPDVLMMHAGGVRASTDAYEIMLGGADGTGSTSGILGDVCPAAAAARFITAVRRGYEERDLSVSAV